MRLFPILFSMNYVCYEIVPEVRKALEDVGFYVYEAACIRRDGSYIGRKQFMEEIKHYLEAARYTCVNHPNVEVAVVIHYDNPDIFLDKKLQHLVGEDPFINYVDAATNETSVCAFREGKMECLYQTDNMPPYAMLGHHMSLCMNDGFEMHIIPVEYKHACVYDAIFSVHERWFETINKDKNSASYLRTYQNPYNGSVVKSELYDAMCVDGTWKCQIVSGEHQGRRFLEDISRNVYEVGSILRTYDCYEIIGTDCFLLTSNGEYDDLLISLSSTKEQMNKFLDSKLCKELVTIKK